MPPHCDSLDGPVVRAARLALESGDVDRVLPYVHEEGEAEVRTAFDRVVKAREQGAEARDVADLYFFETVVRIHRAGEGAPFTGLKPAGLDVGPAIPLAETAIETGSIGPLADFLTDAVRAEVHARFDSMLTARSAAGERLAGQREYVEAMLGLQVWAHKLFRAIHAGAHEAGGHQHEGAR